ncbi:hypothetical protein [Actinokineospora xionganensis]|uniref:Uncharacterized protein n=1 Tax=Actinokineospora xionganensis TaxID=2684470 RepID=A0ABR7L2S3_9PSEU|nr:hypothetical protein [Actinokineospora xionganensis]MBC6446691.1 hypothetical protein [Actinokineospora xionganensis]
MPDEVKALLGRALDGEPPLDLDRDAIFADGRARLRRRRSIAIGGAAMAVVVAVVGTSALAGGLIGQSADDLGLGASASAPPSRPPVSVTTSKARPSTTENRPPVEWPRLTDELLTGKIPWPAEVTSVRGKPGSPRGFQFDGATLELVLGSASGERLLTVRVEPPNTLRMFCRQGEYCFREEMPTGLVVRTKTDHSDGRETVFANVRMPNGEEISLIESAWGDRARPHRLLPYPLFTSIGTTPGLRGYVR